MSTPIKERSFLCVGVGLEDHIVPVVLVRYNAFISSLKFIVKIKETKNVRSFGSLVDLCNLNDSRCGHLLVFGANGLERPTLLMVSIGAAIPVPSLPRP